MGVAAELRGVMRDRSVEKDFFAIKKRGTIKSDPLFVVLARCKVRYTVASYQTRYQISSEFYIVRIVQAT